MQQEKLSAKISQLERDMDALNSILGKTLTIEEVPADEKGLVADTHREVALAADAQKHTMGRASGGTSPLQLGKAVERDEWEDYNSSDTTVDAHAAGNGVTAQVGVATPTKQADAPAGPSEHWKSNGNAAAATAQPDAAIDAGPAARSDGVEAPLQPDSGPQATTDLSGGSLQLPKQRQHDLEVSGRRRSANPFRVISVGGTSASSRSRNTSASSATAAPGSNAALVSAAGSDSTTSNEDLALVKLQRKHDYLTMKCVKLSKEIKYLNNLCKNGALSVGDIRKLGEAIAKLQEFLDRKAKEKYEIGVLLSRKIRKQIDSGASGQFWVGAK